LLSRARKQAVAASGQAGVTLMEMVIVIGLIAILAGISFPGITSGLDSLHLTSATDNTAAFLNGALNRAERRQQPIEILILPDQNKFELYSNEPGFSRELKLPDGITLEAVLPRIAGEPDNAPRRLILAPGATPPAIGIQLASRKGQRRIVRLDPMTGFPRVESVPRL
jgi:prepilin-type N-terminal cleavage/methylation domain-containing protein